MNSGRAGVVLRAELSSKCLFLLRVLIEGQRSRGLMCKEEKSCLTRLTGRDNDRVKLSH